MSCSITITERFLQMRLSSSAVFALATLMPATGSSSISKFRVLHQQHADLEPLLLAVADSSRLRSSRSARKIILGDFLHAVAHSSVRLNASAPNTCGPRGNDISRFWNTVRFS
jgi:hypothetical protein